MADANTRERKRLRLSVLDSDTDAWNFLSPWFEQLKKRLVVVSGGYLQVLDPDSPHRQMQGQPTRYDVCDWRTREALELLVLVHSVNNRAWVKLLLDKCSLKFADEEDPFNVNNSNDDDEEEEFEEEDEDFEEDDEVPTHDGDRSDDAAFLFECDHDREVPLSPRFHFRASVGNRNSNGGMSSVAKWRNFFLSRTSNYEPSPEFLAARRRILMMQDEEFKKRPRVPRSIEIPVSFELDMRGSGFAAQMNELRELIHDMKHYASQKKGRNVTKLEDCASSFTYRIELLSLDIIAVKLTEACVDSVLQVLGAGIPIGNLELDVYRGPPGRGDSSVSETVLMRFFSELLVEPSDPLLKIHSIDYFCFSGDKDWQYDVLYSTLAAARTPVATLAVADHRTRRDRVGLLAQALFFPPPSGPTSYPSIRGLDISCSSLYKRDLQTFADVVRGKAGRSGVEKPRDRSGLVEVILPGYGACQVPRGALVLGAPRETGPVSSLSMNFSGSADALKNLLSQIGWPLRSLSLQFFCRLNATSMMTAILKSCPKLTSLSLHPSEIDLNQLITTYEQFGGAVKPEISALSLIKVDEIGADHGVAFAERLGDPATRLAKHLLELSIETGQESRAVNDSTLRALWFALKNNTKLKKLELTVEQDVLRPWVGRFQQLHGQVLPPVPVDLPSKLAFLSVIDSSIYLRSRELANVRSRWFSTWLLHARSAR